MKKHFHTIRDTLHGYEHDTRMVLAISTMAVAVIVFFYVWAASLPSHLIVLSPAVTDETYAAEQSAPVASAPYAPVARGGMPVPAAEDSSVASAPTPVQGIGEIFRGAASLLAPASDVQSASSGGFAASIGRGAASVYGAVASAVAGVADFADRVLSPYIAPTY